MEVDKQRIAELVGKVQSGDNSAFEELYKTTGERAYFVALTVTYSDGTTETVTDTSAMKVRS